MVSRRFEEQGKSPTGIVAAERRTTDRKAYGPEILRLLGGAGGAGAPLTKG